MCVNETGLRVRLRSSARFILAAGALAASFAMICDPPTATAKVMQAGFTLPTKADRILVLKSARKLELLKDGVVVKTYPIALGGNPIGPKRIAGDSKTPEGLYYIDGRQPHSRYYLALHISYPNAADRDTATAAHLDPGGDIEIHGLPDWYAGPLNPVRFPKDWTHGCISVGDRAMAEIYRAVDIGTPIEIRP